MILIPELLWSALFETWGRVQVPIEQVAFLDGIVRNSNSVVTTLTFPDAECGRQNYAISSQAMSQAGQHLFQLALVRLAQVHTHPGRMIDHSPWDDDQAYSQHPGAVSIVVPEYGRRPIALEHTGVHVRTPSAWSRVPTAQVPHVIGLLPSILDFRSMHERYR